MPVTLPSESQADWLARHQSELSINGSKTAVDGEFFGRTGILLTQSDSVRGALKARIAQLLMLAAYHEVIDDILGILPQLLAQLPPTGGLNYLVIFVRYLADTQAPDKVEKLIELTKDLSPKVGGEMLTARQAWRLEGEKKGEKKGKLEGKREGELKGKLETVESFLKAGVGWDIISHATGITQEKLQELKLKLQEMGSSSAETNPLNNPIYARYLTE